MWEVLLQDLKESSVSNVEPNTINLRENNRVNVNADMLQRAREVRELYECSERLWNNSLKVTLDHSTSSNTRVTSLRLFSVRKDLASSREGDLKISS